MRARNIKPGFFFNEDLAELEPMARLLFIGLWCFADRDGRFEWRPKKIKASIFPYDNCNIEKLLMSLHAMSFIYMYHHNNVMYGLLPKFVEHQRPHPHEAKSDLPEPPKDLIENYKQYQCHDMDLQCNDNEGKCQSDTSDILIAFTSDTSDTSDSLIADSKPLSEYSDDFVTFWTRYPSKVGKGEAWKAWKKKRHPIGLILTALEWQVKSRKWLDGYIPNPSTYLNQRRWEDEPDDRVQSSKLSSVNHLLSKVVQMQTQGGINAPA